MIDSIGINLAQQAMVTARLIVNQEDDPGYLRWSDPAAAQDAAEEMLRAVNDMVDRVQATLPTQPTG